MVIVRRSYRSFLSLTVLLTIAGFFIFFSASLGLLNRPGAKFDIVSVKQLVIMLVGFAACLVCSKIHYRYWQKSSGLVFLLGLVVSALVFVPELGFAAGGARRWVIFAGMSIQTSEFLKLGYIIYLANWLARARDKIQTFRGGLLPFLLISGLVGVVMVAQPDLSTFGIMLAGGLAMLFAAGIRWRQLLLLGLIALITISVVIYLKPYTQARIKTFLNPNQGVLGSSYQVNQSLIAIGSGGLTGRGFGQSIQKFKYLPEPIGDSIFSVASEEFGFIGATILLLLFLALSFSGLKIANQAPNHFSRLLTVGIVIMIVAGMFINVASMVGLIPLNGTPLLFVSQGGTALLLVLIEAGIILNISKHLTR